MRLLNTLYPGLKGYPLNGPDGLPCHEIARQGWNVLAGDLPLPLAVLQQGPLQHNLQWLQTQATGWGVRLAPHGKTTLSPQLFEQQLHAGAWGISFANVQQLALGVNHGVRRALIANQVLGAADLAALAQLQHAHADLFAAFWVDSQAQLALIQAQALRGQAAGQAFRPWPVLLELGLAGGRTGCRSHEEALALAQAVRESTAVRLVGISCYEGLNATGDDTQDTSLVEALMQRVQTLAHAMQAQGSFDKTDEIIITAGGSALFDVVAPRLRLALSKPVLPLLRSGCYLTHDSGHYKRLVHAVERRLGCAQGSTLQGALQVWAQVQSQPEPGLALLNAGRRDLSFDIHLPTPLLRAPLGSFTAGPVPASWRIVGLNDQHAHLRWDEADAAQAPQVGERVALGISHPCTTFDKWAWMPIVDEHHSVVNAIRTGF